VTELLGIQQVVISELKELKTHFARKERAGSDGGNSNSTSTSQSSQGSSHFRPQLYSPRPSRPYQQQHMDHLTDLDSGQEDKDRI